MKRIIYLVIVLFLLITAPAYADHYGQLANAKTTTGTDNASINHTAGLRSLNFQVEISSTATVALQCSLDNGSNYQTMVTYTADALFSTPASCTNIQSDVSACSSCTVTVTYKATENR